MHAKEQIFVLESGSKFHSGNPDRQWEIREGMLFVKKAMYANRQRRFHGNQAPAWDVVLKPSQTNLWHFGKDHQKVSGMIYAASDQLHVATPTQLELLRREQRIKMQTISMF